MQLFIPYRIPMKNILLVSLLAAPMVLADISLGGTPLQPSSQSAGADAQEYITMAREVLNCVNELTGILTGVSNKETADAAAPKVDGITTRLLTLQAKSEGMPMPTPEVEMQVRSSMNVQEVQKTVSDFLGAVIKLGMSNAYGSDALMNALGPIMNAMPGQAEN